MARDPERPVWKGQRPWFEIYFAVVIDESRRRALWIRQTLFVPRQGDSRTTIWGAWFDADAATTRGAQRLAAKRYLPIDELKLGENERLIEAGDSYITQTSAVGSVDGLSWDVGWTGGRDVHADVPSWIPAPTHAQPIVHDAAATGHVLLGGGNSAAGAGPRARVEIKGRATAMHLWGKRRVPTLQWIWAPWIGDGSLEVQAVSFRDTFSLGLATLRLDGPSHLHGRPATAARPSGLVTSTVAGARKLIHARAWAEPSQMVGYAYRDTDGRDVMVAQSDIGSAQLEVFTRTAPGVPWKLVDDRRVAGGVAVEIHQHAALPDVDYIPWDATTATPRELPPPVTPGEDVAWPEVNAIVALGLTYGDHVRETGQKLDLDAPPTSFTKHARAFTVETAGDARSFRGVRIPESAELLDALDAIEPGIAETLRTRIPIVPAVMDYEGELALVALDAIDDEALARGMPQPFGVAAANDLTARFCQVLGETTDRPLEYWACAKSFPGFLPVAPRVWAPSGGIAKMPELTLETRVNGLVRQQASTKLIVYDLAAMVRAARAHLQRPLVRGDVILTGTPAGVGLRMSPLKRKVAELVKDRFRKAELLISMYASSTALLRPGDVVEVDAGPAGRVRTRMIVG
jgi:2-keto-4-pentenoate hydratase/2-oxohepta-3-ene-1,7-dioic acid hydratase in catechol pathway